MLKQVPLYILFIISFASCSSLKTAFNGNRQPPSSAGNATKKETKFLDIETPVEASRSSTVIKKPTNKTVADIEGKGDSKKVDEGVDPQLSFLQVKYSVLLNTPAEEIRNTKMFEFIEDWYGTPYKLGGTSKTGIDCSAFSQFLFASVYGISIARTARDQHSQTNRISRTQLKEGDLIFFNTRGGISHVGVYLQNNKFVHASTSGGVMISDVFDDYWARKFVGVGRLKDHEIVANLR